MAGILAFLRRRADNVAVALLTAMFATFVIQIVSRYVLDAPVGWSVEVCLTTWLWVVFWDAAFGLADQRPRQVRHLLPRRRPAPEAGAGASSRPLAIAGGLIASMPATYSYITFYKIKTSATLHLRLDYVFSVYGIFAVATVLEISLAHRPHPARRRARRRGAGPRCR